MTGILVSLLPEVCADSEEWGVVVDPQRHVEEAISSLFAHTHYLLTLKGRLPCHLAGLETEERLHQMVQMSLNWLSHHLDLPLVSLYQGRQAALAPFALRYDELDQGAVWRRDIADILGPG